MKRENKLVRAGEILSRGKGYLHVAIYNLLQRDAVVSGGLSPREAVEWLSDDDGDRNHVGAFRDATRELLGREVSMQLATRPELEQLRARLSDRVRGTPGEFPEGWREFLTQGAQ